MGNNGEFVYERWEITNTLGLIQKCNDKKSSPPYTFFINNEFELIEEQQDIDIQAIEKVEPEDLIIYKMLDVDTKEENTIVNSSLGKKINQMLEAVKQLDRREER